MAKLSLGLVFALVLSVALHSVLCDDNPWLSVIEQAKSEATKAGLSEDTIFGAEKAVADGSAQKAAEEAMNSGSFNDWVQQAGVMVNEGSSAQNLPDDEEEDNLGELEFAPKRFTSEAPAEAPTEQILIEEVTMELSEEPSEGPQAQSPSAE
ncbi:hypothetical protein VIGAN_03282000 [Vigna angularis var. angularis]|uniref:Uncharacterized protein n=1 Tax=Vigna angularis var. angularis TaxID=157739 RepID=A0A0S3RQA7_PHAAN|nr:uncharacterized protein LOC108337885 [Vigna angularis]BAT82761.1 hypothetical protein VIGAN_03282000 [Vigna angularis var. angularis]